MNKRKDECLFCKSRKCYERVVTNDDDGKAYDEIACIDHVKDLYKHSDEDVPKVMRIFSSSTGRQKRGEQGIFEPYRKAEATK